jgi:hypothetical protein
LWNIFAAQRRRIIKDDPAVESSKQATQFADKRLPAFNYHIGPSRASQSVRAAANVGGGDHRIALRNYVLRFPPEPLRNLNRFYLGGPPPLLVIAAAMQIAVVDAAQGNRELIADLVPKSARLPEPDVIGIGGTPAADEGRVANDKSRDAIYRVLGLASKTGLRVEVG